MASFARASPAAPPPRLDGLQAAPDASTTSAPTQKTMGAAPSAPPQRARRSRFPALPASGRYAVLHTPAGGVVHVLGFHPCSTQSEEEAADLVAAVRPAALYLDLHPELVQALEAEVAAGRSSADGRAWRVPERSAPYARFPGAGWLVSLHLRNALADNEMFALLGAEALGAPKAALGAARALAPAPRVAAFPFSMDYNAGETLARPLEAAALLVGDSSVGSTRVTAVVGNPNAWQYVSGDAAKNTPAVEHEVALPAAGYFTRDAAAAAQAAFRAAVNKVASRATADSADVDRDLQEREAEARAKGDAASADLLAERAIKAQAFTGATAWALHALADAEVDAARGAGAGAAPGAAAAAPRPVVALVNVGAMGALKRNWAAPVPPEVALPPFSTLQMAVGNAVPVVVLAPLAYGVYRAARRFPRTTAAFGVIVGGAAGTVVYTTMYGDWTRYGVAVRSALASPRVTSPLARINR